MLKDPAKVAVTPQAPTVERVDQRVVHVDKRRQAALLSDVILRQERSTRALVFTRTKHGADRVVRNLAKSGIVAEAIHGNKSQGQRERALEDFRAGRVRALVATDIAARGIDVDGISHVINFELPNEPGKLRPPHRPHRARRRRRHRDLALRRRRGGVPARHREADPDGYSPTGQASAPRPGFSNTAAATRHHGRPGQQQRNGKARDGHRNERGQHEAVKSNHGAMTSTRAAAATAAIKPPRQCQCGPPPDRLDPAGRRRFC